MPLNIDYGCATKILQKALKNRTTIDDVIADKIKTVILGSHKTYKYILVTNLLAKATNERANALSLQAGAPLNGAFDSRSLCHKVLVPFEREFLVNALGASNEPYLNKPARFTHLSDKNPVRAGKDKEILCTLIEIAEYVNASGSKAAYNCLSYCFSLLESVIANNELLTTVNTIMTPDLIDIYRFIARYIEESFEGETCATVVGAVEKQFYSCLKGEFLVKVHKVNESGASSKEIGDIDVYENDKCFYSIEVKDKEFTIYDVEHAFNKMIAAHVNRGSFVYGPRATFDEEQIKITLYSFEQKKFITLFMGVLPYARLVLFQTPYLDTKRFLQILLDTAWEINSKECTRLRIHELSEEMFGNAT